MAPSVTQPSSINWSMIEEMVLRCSLDRRARSARDIGWYSRMKLSAMRRLICLAVSLVAGRKSVRSIFRMPLPAGDETPAPGWRRD